MARNPTILGLDPGLQTTGFGLIKSLDDGYKYLDGGVILTSKDAETDRRLLTIYEEFGQLVEKLRPDVVSIERVFFNRNITSGINVSKACGILSLVCAQHNLPVFEYTPLEVKMSLAGYGRASKAQIQEQVQRLLSLNKKPTPDDLADALAIAITHSLKSRIDSLKN